MSLTATFYEHKSMYILMSILAYMIIGNYPINPISIRGGCKSSKLRWHVNKNELNKLNHSKNGNISKEKPKIIKNLKVLHLNKGSKYLSNTDELINDLIIREDPDIFSLAESNVNFNDDKKEIGAAFENYNIELKKMNPCPKNLEWLIC